jgi:hypothetical protein
MNRNVRKAALAAVAVVGAIGAGASPAAAVFPNFTGCPSGGVDFQGCINIQSRSGSLTIKGFTVPLGESLEIRGGLRQVGTASVFLPARGTNGFFARDIQVPGGLLGINFPLPGNAVTARAQLVGPASNIRLDLSNNSVSLPVKLKLTNPLLGSGCQIASDSNPVRLNLITGTTSPPAPNRPITGSFGDAEFYENYLIFRNARNVDNSFSISGANNCGFFPIGILIDGLVNAKLRLPSASGNNTMIVGNDIAIGSPPA